MPGKLNKALNLISNMGWRYISFRARHEVLKRTGMLKSRFPAAPPYQQYCTLDQWKSQKAQFFFYCKRDRSAPRYPDPALKATFQNIKAGKLLLFNSVLTDLGSSYDWVTNPDSGFRYDKNKHWTEIADYSKEAGDIKYVWERSRFSYLYDIIRYDHHFNDDCATFVFTDIISWINSNPINCGPNYRCSQEMALRVLNWTFALYYYRDSPELTDEVFGQMQHTIYWHLHHIYHNIDFSRIAVRNNHAITETLTLYLAGLFYPAMPGADVWKQKGKAWFEEEIAYQIYEDGTFLQYSMNYHRILAQLLTWGIALSERNGERFSPVVYERAHASFRFLRTCMVEENGWLPNYGANDGALFFKLSNAHYRDYRPQLQALGCILGIITGFADANEDCDWYGFSQFRYAPPWIPADGLHSFQQGGYYIIREPHTLTFIKCGRYKDRPSQADALHIDIWYHGENLLLDAGSYKYNTDAETMRYFSGTRSHNTVMLGDNDQMLKGGHFIWFYWSQCTQALLADDGDDYIFTGAVRAFTYISKGIQHRRTIIKQKGKPVWTIKDEIVNAPAHLPMRQLWHLPLYPEHKVDISAHNDTGAAITPETQEGWYSSLYGQKEKTNEVCFTATASVIKTIVSVHNKTDKEQILDEIKEAVDNLKLTKENKATTIPMKDLLDEL